MEIAEVASMTMELFSMDYWDVFFDNEEDLKRAKEHQLERELTICEKFLARLGSWKSW